MAKKGKRAPPPHCGRDDSSSDSDYGEPNWGERNKRRCRKGNWDTGLGTEISLSEEDELLCSRNVPVKDESMEPYLIVHSAQPSKYRKGKKTNHTNGHVEVIDHTAVIRTALDIPVLGLSTFRINTKYHVSTALEAALDVGYRLFDTGAHYGNEKVLGSEFAQNLDRHRLRREDIYLISKIDPSCVTYEDTMSCAERTLNNLQTDYIDIMLIYWPSPRFLQGMRAEEAMFECYSALESLYYQGKIRDIGVYRFGPREMNYLLEQCKVLPAMLQAEFHPYLYRRDLVDICRRNHIRMQAFCFIKCVNDPAILHLSKQYNKAPSQIVLRWIIQHGVGVLPKSKTPSHIQENANIFDFSLSPSDMDMINALNRDTQFTPHPPSQ